MNEDRSDWLKGTEAKEVANNWNNGHHPSLPGNVAAFIFLSHYSIFDPFAPLNLTLGLNTVNKHC